MTNSRTAIFIAALVCAVAAFSTRVGASAAPIQALIQDGKVYIGQMATSGSQAGRFVPCGSSASVALHVPRRLITLNLDRCPSGITLAALKSGLLSMQLRTLSSVVASRAIGSGGVRGPFAEADLEAASSFAGCDPATVTKNPQIIAADLLKNREQAPDSTNAGVTLAAMLTPGDDTDRFTSDDGASIVGYVKDVKPGGSETVNCKATDPDHTDTHIEIIDPNNPTKPVIVEVTPRLRYLAGLQGVDWSTQTLCRTIMNQWVQVTGWLFFDGIHSDASENTNPGGPRNWRETAWEIHPVTNLTIVNGRSLGSTSKPSCKP